MMMPAARKSKSTKGVFRINPTKKKFPRIAWSLNRRVVLLCMPLPKGIRC